MDTAQTIAAGGQLAWTGTYEHPEHGTLTFTVEELPKNRDWLAHSLMQHAISPGVQSVLAAALAGLQTIIQCPVISEDRKEDPDDPTHVTVTKVFYDPMEDLDPEFPVRVWTNFIEWRAAALSEATKEQVKNSSGATTGPVTDGSSPASTTFRSTTHA